MIEGAVRRTVVSGGIEPAVMEAGDPARVTIVFIHGYPDAKEMWNAVLERLAPSFHVVAYDVRGAGASSAPRGPAAYDDLERLGDDLDAIISAVAPGERVHLVGPDWGGIQGWEFATSTRFEGKLASFTTIAGPSHDQVIGSGHALARRGALLRALHRARRSWYVLALCAPGGPTLLWRGLLAGGRWRESLRALDRLPVDDRLPAPTLTANGLHGSNLYRRNIPRRMLRPRREATPTCPSS